MAQKKLVVEPCEFEIMIWHIKKTLIFISVFLILFVITDKTYSLEKSRLGGKKKAVIKSYNKNSCYHTGESIVIRGNGFGEQTGKSLAVGGNGIHIDISTIIEWADTEISAVLPESTSILPNLYYIGIETSGHTKWLSNNKLFKFCNPPAANSASINNVKTGQTASSSGILSTKRATKGTGENLQKIVNDPGTEIYTESSNDPFEEEGNNYDDTNSPNRNYGSLIKRGLPEPPKILIQNTDTQIESGLEPQDVMVANADIDAALSMENLLIQNGIKVKRRRVYENLGFVISILRIPKGEDIIDTINLLRQQLPDLWVDGNQRYALLDANNKSYARELIGWSKKHKNCYTNMKIGLIDTEVAELPSLESQKIINKSYLSAGVKPAPSDHGTAIAALLIGNTQYEEFQGLLPNATLYSAAVFRLRDKKKVDTNAELVISALDWLVGEGVKVINLSFGGPRNLILELVMDSLIDNGYIFVSAAGTNDRNNLPLYPAAQKGVIAVNAIDADHHLAPNAGSGDYIDFSAPGVNVWVATSEGKGKYLTGSSYATPYVTAIAANIAHNNKDVYKTLLSKSLDLGKPGKDSEYGWGLVSAGSTCE